MPRLIDAEKLIEDGYSLERTYRKDSSTMVVERCKIEDIPVLDAVPVVRCKECKHYTKLRGCEELGRCSMHNRASQYHDYCSWAERKEE